MELYKAKALLRSIGSSIGDFVSVTSTAGKLFGAAGGSLGLVKGALGVFDGDIDSHEALDILGGAIGVALAFSPVGWVTVLGGGAVTLAIAIYQNNNEEIV